MTEGCTGVQTARCGTGQWARIAAKGSWAWLWIQQLPAEQTLQPTEASNACFRQMGCFALFFWALADCLRSASIALDHRDAHTLPSSYGWRIGWKACSPSLPAKLLLQQDTIQYSLPAACLRGMMQRIVELLRLGTKPESFLAVYFAIWVWLKIKQEGVRRFWSMFPLTRVPFWYRFFEPQPY